MARRGGYSRDVPGIEWAKLGAGLDAEGKLSAADMRQSYFVWLNDAVAHHVYRCEMIQCKERYRQDCKAAADAMKPSPLESDYTPKGPPPTITRQDSGQSGPTGRGEKPKPLKIAFAGNQFGRGHGLHRKGRELP